MIQLFRDKKIFKETLLPLPLSEGFGNGFEHVELAKTGNHSETTLKRTNIVDSKATSTNLELEPEVQIIDRNDHHGILARLEMLMVDKKCPDFLHESKRMFKFKSIMKLVIL